MIYPFGLILFYFFRQLSPSIMHSCARRFIMLQGLRQFAGLQRSHQRQQGIKGIGVTAAAHLDLRHQRHFRRFERFRQAQHHCLHQLLVGALSLQRFGLGLDRRGFRFTYRFDRRCAAGTFHFLLEFLGMRQRFDFLALLLGRFHIGRPLIFLDRNVHQRSGQLLLLGRTLLSLVEFALLVGRDLLLGERFHLFPRNLAVTQLGHDVFDLGVARLRFRRTDQHFLEFQRIGLETLFHVGRSIGLQLAARLDQLNEGLGLRDILEVRRNHGIQGLLHQLRHVAETLHHHRRLAVVDMHHHRQRQLRFEGILGDQGDFAQVVVEAGTALAGFPHQHEVCGRHQFDLAGVSVERILARHERIAPHAAAAALDQFAMAIFLAGQIGAFAAGVRHHHTHIPDRNDGLLDQFDRRKQAIDIVGTFHQHSLLAAAQAARSEEFFRLLERVVAVADIRRQQFILGQSRPILHGHDGQLVRIMGAGDFLEHNRRKAAALIQHAAHLLVVRLFLGIQRQRIGRLFSHDDKQRRIDDVRAFAQDLALRTFLAAAFKEGTDVAEVLDLGIVGQGLPGRQVDAVARKNITDLALGDGNHGMDMHPELERRKEMKTAAPQVRLKTRLAMQGQQTGLDRSARAPQFLDHADPVVWNVSDDARYRKKHRKHNSNCNQNDKRHGQPAQA
ncbi:hypothetical protein CFU_2245 [Collimonas fungivorans Ter331]|uniref:NAD-specific glutamate dehydrogenase n=1 Tax=Collimonas fungivorans (strain Ter331) TaxID=1005048 RepID=G0AKE5_COLFT|nr:hypothetical protein CFU_2245 [Collimonas fungivorans Ter331]